jgi:hypothetical protein
MESIAVEDFRRLESKVDKLTDAVTRLILLEERQTNQGERIGATESRCAVLESGLQRTDRKVDQWVNRGVGVWAAAAVIFTIVQFGAHFVK